MDDPDAAVPGGWNHWVVFNLPAGLRELPEDQPTFFNIFPNGSVQGRNSWGNIGYGAICPPAGENAHNYRFTLYAVNGFLALPLSSNRAETETALRGRVLDASRAARQLPEVLTSSNPM